MPRDPQTTLALSEVIGGLIGLIVGIIISTTCDPGIISSFFLGFGLTTTGLYYGEKLNG